MSYYVFREPLYQICEVYIDDLLIYGDDDDSFVQNVCTIFQKCREKNQVVYHREGSVCDILGLKEIR